MIDKPTTDEKGAAPKAGAVNPLHGMAAATAVGFAMAAQAVDLWFGVMSGMARASQEMLNPHLDRKSDEPAAYAPIEKSASVKAKSAARTVVAEIERTARDVADVASELLGIDNANPQVEEPKVERSTEPVQPSASIVELMPRVETMAGKPASKAAARKVASTSRVEPDKARPAETTVVDPAEQPQPEIAIAAVAGAAKQLGAVATIMPEDFKRPQAIDMPAKPDDLKLIAGVGPKLEKVLNGLGIWTFDQLAELSAEEIAWVDDYLGLAGRFGRDRWAEQAMTLTAGGDVKAASGARA